MKIHIKLFLVLLFCIVIFITASLQETLAPQPPEVLPEEVRMSSEKAKWHGSGDGFTF